MISSVDLFAVAGDGIRRESSAAALSRAVSTLYYSLFHALLETARSRVAECTNEKLLQHYIASFDHIALKDVALQVGAGVDQVLSIGHLIDGGPEPKAARISNGENHARSSRRAGRRIPGA